MALLAGAVLAKFGADISEFKKGVSEAQSQMSGLKSHIGGIAGNIATVFSDLGRSISTGMVTAFNDAKNAAMLFGAVLGGGLLLLGKQALGSASDFEQARIAFDTMLGDADKAGSLLRDISKFAERTPFNLPQLVEGSKRLLAYNIEAEKIIPTMEALGNITAGVGREKLPQLITAYGQVKAATKLTGAELRQFSEAGVPLLEALVNKANETGGAFVKVSGESAELQKKSAKLSATIVDQKFKLDYLANAGEKGSSAYKTLAKSIDFNKEKLKSFGSVGEETFVKVEATASSMIDQISDGGVSFEMVEEAIAGMSGEGGKFFDLMARQSKTFGGRISNIQDKFDAFLRTLVGVNNEGLVQEGSIFASLSSGLEMLLDAMNNNVQPIIDGFNGLKTVITDFFTALSTGDTEEYAKKLREMGVDLDVINNLLKFIETLQDLGQWVVDNKETLIDFGKGMAIAFGFSALAGTLMSLMNPLNLLMVAVGLLYTAWNQNWGGIQEKTKAVIDAITGFYKEHEGEIKAILDAIVNIILIVLGIIKIAWDTWGDDITRIVTGSFNAILGIIRFVLALITGIINTTMALIKGDWSGAWESLRRTSQTMLDSIIQIFIGFGDNILGVLGIFLGSMIDKFIGTWEKIKKVAGDIRHAISDAFNIDKRNSPSISDRLKEMVRASQSALDSISVPTYRVDIAKNMAMDSVFGQKDAMGNKVVQYNTLNVRDQLDLQQVSSALAFGVRQSL